MGKSESRTYTMLPSLAMAVGMPLGGWLTDKAHAYFDHPSGRTLVPKLGMVLSAGLLVKGNFFQRDVLDRLVVYPRSACWVCRKARFGPRRLNWAVIAAGLPRPL